MVCLICLHFICYIALFIFSFKNGLNFEDHHNRATGTVGSFLIPKLKSKSHELVVVGRDKIEVGKRFAGLRQLIIKVLKML